MTRTRLALTAAGYIALMVLCGLGLLLIMLSALGCGASSPTRPTPTPPPIPACQTNNTADVALRNTSPNNLVFDVSIDGVSRATIRPTETTPMFTVSAGATHRIIAHVTNTTIIACDASPSFAQCSTQTLTCSY